MIYHLGERLGHMDSTGGVVRYGYPLTALAVADEFGNGVPVAFMISNAESADEVQLFVKTVQEQVTKDFAEVGGGECRFKNMMIDKSKAEMSGLSLLEIFWVLCWFHVLQELQRFLRSAESGVRNKEEQQRILREIEELKLCKSRAQFEQRSSVFMSANQAYPHVLQR